MAWKSGATFWVKLIFHIQNLIKQLRRTNSNLYAFIWLMESFQKLSRRKVVQILWICPSWNPCDNTCKAVTFFHRVLIFWNNYVRRHWQNGIRERVEGTFWKRRNLKLIFHKVKNLVNWKKNWKNKYVHYPLPGLKETLKDCWFY